MTALQHISPALAVGTASLGAAIWACARDRITDRFVTRGHAILDQALVGDTADGDGVQGNGLAQLANDERDLVDAAAGQSGVSGSGEAVGGTSRVGDGAGSAAPTTPGSGRGPLPQPAPAGRPARRR